MSVNQMQYYPQFPKLENSSNPAIRIYGNRFHYDQSVYEYLIEFLLVFSSAKSDTLEGKLEFHHSAPLHYYVEPRNGFRRFVFFEQAKKSKRIIDDEKAIEELKKILMLHIEASNDSEKEQFLLTVRDLFHGYAAVLKKRSWCAQALLPLCPEMVLCEEMPNDTARLKGPNAKFQDSVSPGYDVHDTFVDASFDLSRHNFLARGGEMYYLHLMQVLENRENERLQLEKLLQHLLTDKSEKFSALASWIQNTWEKHKSIDPKHLVHEIDMGYIPAGAYLNSGLFAVNELCNFLSNQLHPVKRIELLAKGIMFQVMRMQLERTAQFLNHEPYPIIIDMKAPKAGSIIRQVAAKSFRTITDAFSNAINQYLESVRKQGEEIHTGDEFDLFMRAKKESLDVFRSKGKELQCIIPMNGPYERFSLSEDIVRFLTLSIVKPGTKMDLDTFLAKLYEHFNLVIGPSEYSKICGKEYSAELTNSFTHNKDSFQEFLKATGFLRDLSDATSIVVNPYEEIESI